jgi:hypothetical protein
MPTSLPSLITLPSRNPTLVRSEGVVYTPPPAHEVQWTEYDPHFFERATGFEGPGTLTIESAKATLRATLDAETTPFDRYEMRAVVVPRDDGTSTFRIIYAHTSSREGKSTAELGIADAIALEYMACDYIQHRLFSSALRIPPETRTAEFNAQVDIVFDRMQALHLDLLCFIVK